MKAKIATGALAFLVVVSAGVTGYILGQRATWIMEFKECHAHLTTLVRDETNRPPELREYVKARYYHLANKMPKDLVGQPIDYGPISTNVATIAVFKGPSSGREEHAAYLERFNFPKPPRE